MRAGNDSKLSKTIEIEVKCISCNTTIFNKAVSYAIMKEMVRCENWLLSHIYDWAAFLKGKQSDDEAPITLRLCVKDGIVTKIVGDATYERWQEQKQIKEKAVITANMSKYRRTVSVSQLQR